MRVNKTSFFIIYFIYMYEIVTCENWRMKTRNLLTQTENFSGYVNTSAAFKSFHTTAVYRCVSECFLSADSSFYYRKYEKLCYCFAEKLDLDFDTTKNDTAPIYGFYLHGFQILESGSFQKWELISKPSDCLTIFESGFDKDGVYIIYPSGLNGVAAWCDMTRGGWTVIQRRIDGSEDFNRPWNDYVMGFGNATGELWIGLENIYSLTQSPSSLEITMESFEDVTPSSAYANYSSFSLEDDITNYKLHVGGFSGDCGDSLSYHDGSQFTTIDRDNDGYGANCAVLYEGAWWYNACHYSNLNGLYLSGSHSSFANGINWHACWGHYYSVKYVVMKVRRIRN